MLGVHTETGVLIITGLLALMLMFASSVVVSGAGAELAGVACNVSDAALGPHHHQTR